MCAIKAASAVRQVLQVTKSNASHSHSVEDPSKMFVLEAYVGKVRWSEVPVEVACYLFLYFPPIVR